MVDLNEHIKRMKELFLAEHGIVKPLLSEQDPKSRTGQVTQSGVGKENPDILFDSEYQEDFPVKASKEKEIRTRNPKFDEQLAELKKNPAYKPLIEKIKDDSKEMTIFFFYLNQTSRLTFLKITLDFLQSFTKRRKLARELKKNPNYTGESNLYNWEANLAEGNVVNTEVPTNRVEGEESLNLEIPLEVAGRTVYKDNSTQPDVSLVQAIDKWVQDAKTSIDEIKALNPQATVELISVDIASSCSRLRNTGEYEGKTWSQLSKDRAEVVYQLMAQKLESIGVGLNPNVQKVLRGGYNGDGSSGPDPANTFTFYDGRTTNKMSYSKTGAEKLSGPDNVRQVFNYGTLLPTQKDSDQYKFCIALAVIKITAKQQGIEPMKPMMAKSQGYSLELNPLYEQKEVKLKVGRQFKVKGGNVSNQSYDIPKVRGKLAQCAAYGNKINR